MLDLKLLSSIVYFILYSYDLIVCSILVKISGAFKPFKID